MKTTENEAAQNEKSFVADIKQIIEESRRSAYGARYIRNFRKFYVLFPDYEIWKARLSRT